MKETFRNIPSPLQKVILIRFGASGAALFMLIGIEHVKARTAHIFNLHGWI